MNVHAQQNLVANPSFEEHYDCPSTTNPWTVQNWSRTTATPDYYHSCVVSSFPGATISTPCNNRGCQSPLSGNAYVGIWAFSLQHPDIGREYIQTELQQPLHSGIRYVVSFYVSLAEIYGGYAVSTLGAALTEGSLDTVVGGWRLDAEPQIMNDPLYPITDTTNWVWTYYI